MLIGGCHPGDCHYQEGNYKALRRFRLLQRLLEDMGIEEDASAWSGSPRPKATASAW